MDKLTDADTSFLVPCLHCDALFSEGERFCPSCGEDQVFSSEIGTQIEIGRDLAKSVTERAKFG